MLLFLMVGLGTTSAVPIELKDDGDGLTGPQPSIIGSLDKVFNKVNKFDQYQCLQKMICEAMGTAEDLVVAGVNSQFGQQGGQIAQSGFNQLQSNPNQFVQTQLGQGSPLVQAATAQLGPGSQGLFQSGQQVFQSGQQFLNSGQQFIQQLPNQQNVNQFQTNFRPQNQFQQQGQFAAQNQFGQTQFGQNQFGQNQFGQNQFSSQSQFGQSQFGQKPSGGIVDSLVDGLAGMLASVPIGKRRRRRRETTMHGQAIRLMQNLGLANMGAYPYVRAAIIGHANKASPGSCAQLYIECPSGSDQLLSYFNNHNGGLGQNVVPSVTNEVGSLFPGLAALPQVAASTFGEFASSSSSSSSSGGGGAGLVDTVLDTVAGFIAGATLPNQSNNGRTLDKPDSKSLPKSDRKGAS